MKKPHGRQIRETDTCSRIKDQTISAEQRERATAFHEAGHAVAHLVLGYPLIEVTSDSLVDGKLGHTHGEVLTPNLKEVLDWSWNSIGPADFATGCDDTVILLAGPLAEAHSTGDEYAIDLDSPRDSDEREITGRIVLLSGSPDEQDGILAELSLQAESMVEENWIYIELLAAELQSRRTISGSEVIEAIEFR